MIQPIMHDPLFLAQKSAPATPEDAPVARDLLDTLTAHADGCVGMAANMIGVRKRIIAVEAEDGYLVLFNPVILKKSGQYEAEEGCLSLEGVRKTKRWQSIKVQYQTMDGKLRIKTFTGWTAQIIQHEIDHCDGIFDLNPIAHSPAWDDFEWLPLSGCGTQHPHRALGGTRVLLAAAPTTPPCFHRWWRSSLLHSSHFQRKIIFNSGFRNACGRF